MNWIRTEGQQVFFREFAMSPQGARARAADLIAAADSIDNANAPLCGCGARHEICPADEGTEDYDDDNRAELRSTADYR